MFIDTRRTTSINTETRPDYIASLFGYPDDSMTTGFNVKYVTFDGTTNTIFSSQGVSMVEFTAHPKKYKVTWATPFQTDNYAIIGASNFLGTYGSAFTVSGVVDTGFIEIQTPTMDNINRKTPKSDYVSIKAIEYNGELSCSPTGAPSISPTQPPSISPSMPPSIAPSISPSQPPSLVPTHPPSIAPSIAPTQPPSNVCN